MKRKILLSLLALAAITFSATAQKGVDDGSRYGKGEDSIRCVTNITLYITYCKSGNFKDAAEFWQIVYNECPASSRDLYLWGSRIVAWQIQNEKDPAKRVALFDKLMEIYDKRIKYFGEDPRYPKAWILGRKAIDYVTYKENDPTKKPAYEWLKECISTLGPNSDLTVLHYYSNISYLIFTKEPKHKEEYIKDFLLVCKYLDQVIQAGGNTAEEAKSTKAQIEQAFAGSGAADCETLERIYGPQVEKNKENLAWLKETISLMNRVKCNETEAFFAASSFAHAKDPSSESAWGCAKQSIKKENYTEAIKYLEEAISLEKDADRKADYYYTLAQLQYEQKAYIKARNSCLEAIKNRSNFGLPYILIARMYAAEAKNTSSDPIIASCAYYLVVDKLEKAKDVDPSVAEIANKLISTYRAYYPSNESIFMHNDIKKGQAITIGGWIGERTVVR